MCKNYSLLIQNISVATKVSTMCRCTTWFTKNYNLQRFKELQYIDYNMWKVVRYFF